MGLDIDMKTKKLTIYLLEFSFSQRAFHVESLDDAISNNLRLLKNAKSQGLNYVPDYLPIAWSQSRTHFNILKDRLANILR